MKKILLFVVVAAALAVVAVMVLRPAAKSTPVAAAAVMQTKVVVASATRSLQPGDFLSSRDIAWVEVSAQQAQETAVRQSAQAQTQLSGALVVKPLEKGAVVRNGDFLSRDVPEFLSAVLTPGMRAFTIEVDSVTGGAGLLRPGNRVDVILASQSDPNKSRSVAMRNFDVAQTLLTNRRVIAVDRTIEPQGFGVDPKADPKVVRHVSTNINQKGTVTLEVTPKDVEILTVARANGQLSLSLRDAAMASASGDEAERTLTRIKDIVPQRAAAAAPTVKTYYGASSEPPQP